MEFFFPKDNLVRATPAETKMPALHADPYPDGRRVHVNVEMTPFQQRPHLEVNLFNAASELIGSRFL